MNKKLLQPFAALIIPLILLTSCSSAPKPPVYTYVDSAPEHAESVLVRGRGLGSCDSLTGKVHVTAVFVSDASSSWMSQEREAALENIRRALLDISCEAERYSVELSFSISSAVSNIKTTAPAEPDYYSWLEEALESAGLGGISQADQNIREENLADSAPIIFMFNREGRAYASVASDSQMEYCVGYTAEEDSLMHEILHMYGAHDLYYPEQLKTLSTEILGESCMNRANGIDPLTAYLIGWSEEPSAEVLSLFDSLTLTDRDIEQALAAETYTGFASREFGHGKYTGELVFGVADGRGKMTYNEGHVYDGEWKENLPHGTGSMSWANGDTYLGGWKKGKRDGSGTYTWADGSVYVGGYKDDKMHGRGVLTYADGSSVSGTWNMGEFEGA